MATYLDLVRAVAGESGTVNDRDLPLTLAGAAGRIAKMAGWTARAWVSIQNHRDGWVWMQDEFEGQTAPAQARYTGTDLGAVRFARFPVLGPHSDAFTIYRTSDGPSGEGVLRYVDYPAFLRLYQRGDNRLRDGAPSHFTLDQQGRLFLWPAPDGVYTLRGPYRKDVQILTADADVPEMPARFHDLIMWRALVMLAVNDESMNQLPFWRSEEIRLLSELEGDQLPAVRLASEVFA
jgi:hypothetical protein